MEVVDLSSRLTLTGTGTITTAAGDSLGDELLSPNSYTFYGETTVVALLLIIGAALNGPLLYVYCVSNQARSIADKFLINLIIADILSLALLLPTIIVDLFLLERNEEILFQNMTQFVSQISEFSMHFVNSSQNESMLTGDTGSGHGPPSISSTNKLMLMLARQLLKHVRRDPCQNYSLYLIHAIYEFLVQLYPVISATDSSLLLLSSNETGDETGAETPFKLVELVETWDWSCTFKKCLFSGLATASILSTLEIAMERYLAIVAPLHYHKFLTKYKVLMTSFGGGFIAIGSAVLSALDPCEPVFPSCTRITITYTSTFWWPLYTLGHVTLFFILPVLCMAGIYIKIWLEARRQKAKISLQYKKPFFLHVTSSNRTGDELKDKGKFFLHPVVLRFRFIDRFVTARMDRAARVAICTLMVTIVCWSPYYFVQCAHSIRSILEQLKGEVRVRESWSHLESTIPLLAASLHPVLAPLFYGYRYTIIRDRVFLLLKLDRCYPAIRERRSNSVSQQRSPSRSMRRMREALKEQQVGDNNNQQWSQKQGLEQKQETQAKTTEPNNGHGHTVISVEVEDCDGDQRTETKSEPTPPHPFLFTIGAVEDEDHLDATLQYGYSAARDSNRYRNYGDFKSTAYEYSSDNNCSSSDALLPHHYCGDFLYDGTNRTTYPNYTSCLNPNLCNGDNGTGVNANCNTSLSSQPPKSCSVPEININGMLMLSRNKDTSHAQQHCWAMWSNLIQQMVQFYTQRWGSHRQSVSSNSSVVTLLSSRSISSEYLPS